MRSTNRLLQQALEHQLELVVRVDGGCLTQTVVGHGRLDNLVEEELIGLVEVRAEALVHEIDELRKRHGLRPHQAAADFCRAVEDVRASPSWSEMDPSLIFCSR